MMDSEVINAVVDNLADKIGIGIEKLQPLAETVVAETSAVGLFYTLLGAACLFACCLGGWLLRTQIKIMDEKEEPTLAGILGICVVAILFIMGSVNVVSGAPMWLAPTRNVAKMLLG